MLMGVDMGNALSAFVGIALIATFLFLVAYVTWLFAVRLRSKESTPKSFLRWLRFVRSCARFVGAFAANRGQCPRF